MGSLRHSPFYLCGSLNKKSAFEHSPARDPLALYTLGLVVGLAESFWYVLQSIAFVLRTSSSYETLYAPAELGVYKVLYL